MNYLIREIEAMRRQIQGHERVESAMAKHIDALENELTDYRAVYGETPKEEREAA